MGLFSDKNVIQVASVGYNMAGDITGRVDVLKSTVSRHVLLGERKVGLGERIVDVQLNGPAMKQRAWFRWAKQYYDVGEVSGQVGVDQPLAPEDVEAHLGIPSGFTALIDEAVITTGDLRFWAEQHILLTRPEDMGTDWVVNQVSTDLLIQYEDLSTETIPLTGYVAGANYVLVYYRLLEDGLDPEDAVPRLFIYRIGNGNATLDALYVPGLPQEDFFPAIPLRINNLPIDDPSFAAHYTIIKRAYNKATGEKIADVLESIEDNSNIGDVDYATMFFGVEITTQEKCGLRYIYEFFKELQTVQTMSAASFNSYLGVSAPNYPSGGVSARPHKPEPQASILQVRGVSSLMAHNDIRLNWFRINETTHTGIGKVGAKEGDLWFQDMPNISFLPGSNDGSIFGIFFTRPYSIPHSRLFYQIGPNTFQVQDIYGMVHQNYVYGGQAVELTTSAALSGVDEEGFIVPLHYPTLRKMPLLLSNQLALSNRHIIFNCYNVVKVRWYQRGIFKILLGILVSIAIAFIFPGAAGILGTALNVGTSAGLTGASAIILGATANAVAAMVLLSVIEKSAVAIFGEKFGQLFATIIAFIAFQAISNFTSGLGFTIDWGSLMRMENLMGLLNSTVDAVGKWINGEIAGIQTEMQEAGEQYKDDLEALNKRAYELLGAGGGAIDPLMFTETQSRFYPAESRDAFLQRTLMTGSDLIDLSHSMIEDFAELNLMLEKKIA